MDAPGTQLDSPLATPASAGESPGQDDVQVVEVPPDAGSPIAATSLPLPRPVGPAVRTAPGIGELAAAVAVIWAFEVTLGLAVGIIAMVMDPRALEAGVFALSPALVLASVTASNLFAVTAAWYVTCRRYRRSFRDGLAVLQVSQTVAVASIGLGVGGASAAVVVLTTAATGESALSQLVSSPGGLAAMMVMMLIVPPFEEIYYRGFLFPILQRSWGPVAAVTIVTAWFTAAHAFQLAGDWIALPIVGVMGLTWTLLRYYTRSLWPCVISHWIYNAALVTVELAVGAR